MTLQMLKCDSQSWHTGFGSPACLPYSHEKHQLDDRSHSEELGEGVDKQVIGQQQELQQEHQAVVAGLEHLLSALWDFQVHIPQFYRK